MISDDRCVFRRAISERSVPLSLSLSLSLRPLIGHVTTEARDRSSDSAAKENNLPEVEGCERVVNSFLPSLLSVPIWDWPSLQSLQFCSVLSAHFIVLINNIASSPPPPQIPIASTRCWGGSGREGSRSESSFPTRSEAVSLEVAADAAAAKLGHSCPEPISGRWESGWLDV